MNFACTSDRRFEDVLLALGPKARGLTNLEKEQLRESICEIRCALRDARVLPNEDGTPEEMFRHYATEIDAIDRKRGRPVDAAIETAMLALGNLYTQLIDQERPMWTVPGAVASHFIAFAAVVMRDFYPADNDLHDRLSKYWQRRREIMKPRKVVSRRRIMSSSIEHGRTNLTSDRRVRSQANESDFKHRPSGPGDDKPIS